MKSSCDCNDKVNEALKKHNTRLLYAFNLYDKTKPDVMLMIKTEEIEHKRGQKPVNIMVSFCPFCGKKIGI